MLRAMSKLKAMIKERIERWSTAAEQRYSLPQTPKDAACGGS